VCLIDGDGAIFSKKIVERGKEGGLFAVRCMFDAIRERPDTQDPSWEIWVYCFMNKRGLTRTMNLEDATVDAFISGCNRAGPTCFMVDVGAGKEAADSRIKREPNIPTRLHSHK
jgi:hypothetical protein